MSKVLNTPIAPINKGGATGSLAATSMLSAAKDGYSLLVNTLGGMVLAPGYAQRHQIRYQQGFLSGRLHYLRAGRTDGARGVPVQDSQRPD